MEQQYDKCDIEKLWKLQEDGGEMKYREYSFRKAGNKIHNGF